jgi:pimeloyl-ACP methyl ester carboxylesterase
MRDLFHQQERATAFLRRVLDPGLEDTRLKNETTAARLTWAPRGHDPHLRKWLHRIKAPTLVIWGADDRLNPKEHALAYGKLIPGAKVTIIPDCGHLPHIEQPDAFAAALKSFLDAKRIAA